MSPVETFSMLYSSVIGEATVVTAHPFVCESGRSFT
jgi:hypothetical protein